MPWAEIVSHILMLLLPFQTIKDNVYRTIACKKIYHLSNHLHTKQKNKLGSLLAICATLWHKIFRIEQLEAGSMPIANALHSDCTKQIQLLTITFVSVTDDLSITKPLYSA